MKRHTLIATREIEFFYDENSPEFQETALLFADPVTPASISEMLQFIAEQLREFGDTEQMIDGLGYVPMVGHQIPEENYTGIQVLNGFYEEHFD
jgi:hypothetical protein